MRATRWGRRKLLLAAAAAGAAAGLVDVYGQEADPNCRRCRGIGLVPLSAPKPFVYLAGGGSFRAADAVAGQPCPDCLPAADKDALIEQAREQHEAVLRQHKEWEERTDWRLALMETRHVAIHTQHQPVEARRIGQAVEALTIHLQKVTDSVALTPTRPGSYQQVLLVGEIAWEKFRKVLEGLYTPEQLGQPWLPARQLTSYDLFQVPHAYTTHVRLRDLPTEFQAVKFAATRQIMLATNWKAPQWLCEGFGAYGQDAALGGVRISTVYSPERGPKEIYSLRDARQQATARKSRPWDEMLTRELRDFEPADYFQSLGMVAFLLDSEPAKFLDFLQLLRGGTFCGPALEEAYREAPAVLSLAAMKWLAKA